jgi:hypothetical protein
MVIDDDTPETAVVSAAVARCVADIGADVGAIGRRAQAADAVRRAIDVPVLLAPAPS